MADSEHNMIVRSRGGAIARSDCDETLWECYVEGSLSIARSMTQFAEGRLDRLWSGRRILVAAVNAPDINACAMPGQNADHILLYRGLFERLLGYSLALFSTREFLPTIGDASNEQAFEKTAAYFPQLANLKTCHAPVEPRCYIRGWTALILSQFAMNIVVAHEIGHIVGGHFDLLRGGRKITSGLDELGAQEGRLDLIVPLACLEWDADHYASNICWFIQNTIPLVDGFRDWMSSTVKQSKNMTLVVWTLAAHMLFRCLASRPFISYAFDPLLYPPAPLRGAHYFMDLQRRDAFANGGDRERYTEATRVLVKFEYIASHADSISIVRPEWFVTTSKWYEAMGKLYQEYRAQLETVRRTRDSWRPIRNEK